MPKLILVTVGTSALGKLDEQEQKNLPKPFPKKGEKAYNELKSKLLDVLMINIERYFAGEETKKLSAEISSLLVMSKTERIGKIDSKDKIVLFASDTDDGILCAEANIEVIKSYIAPNIEIKKIEGLQVNDPDRFVKSGLVNLQRAINRYSHSPMDVYLNVTGGFKGVLPYVAPLAWENRMTIVYLFELSKDIIIIPPPSEHSFSGMQKETILGSIE